MKTQIFRFILYSIVANLTCLNLTAASSPPSGENGVHFCGVTEQQSDTRRYARSLANLDVGEPRVVRLIYFLPSDRAPEQDIDTKLDTMIKNVQKFYADEMERHGFGRKTFTFEINADGNALVHHVGGRFTSSYYSGNLNIHDLSGKVISEIADRRNRSTNMYLVAVDSGWGGGGTGGGNPSGGSALITIERERFDTSTYLTLRELGYLTAHELGHAFGLSHDFRDPVNIMAYRSGVSPQLSRCNAEWLDAHRYFNPGQVDFDISPTIRMLPPPVSPPNGTRLRFEVTDADGLHQAQLIIPSTISDPTPGVKLWGCKTLSGESDTVEFIMTDLTPNTKEIWLAVINIHGNWTWQNFPIDVASLLPAEVAVSIPTEHLAAAVRQALGLPPSDDITEQSMLELTRLTLNPGNIVNLAGLEHARNLVWLHLRHNQVGDISPLAGLRSLANLELGYNNISDIGPFAGLTRLTILNLPDNNISAVSPLAGLARLKILDLARNNISDIKPIAGLTDLYSLRLSDNSISDISVVAGLTNLTELYLSDNNVSDISAVAGLNNLTQLSLGGNISDIAAVARLTNLTRLILWRNNISDISAVAALTDLTVLGLESNSITDISPVSGLTNLTELYLANNNISDILPLVENTGLGGGDRINVWRNPLSYASINTHIPDLQERGVEVFFHNRTPRRIRNVSGDDQRGSPGTTLEKPFVVEVQDERSVAFEGVPVTFTVTAGDGTLHTTRTATDSNGRAESTLTLGPNPGTNTVTVSVAGSQEKETFNAEGVRTPKTLEIFSGGDQEGAPGAALENPFVVEVRDQTDKPLPGVQVTFSVSSGGGTLSATSATTDSNGRAEGFLTLGPNPGTNTVEVAATGIQEKQTFNAEGIRIPETLDIVSGNDQEGLSGAALENPFVVEVRDQTDKPVPGVEVTFSVTGGGGTLSVTSATTDKNGRAESILILGSNAGTNSVTVSVTGITRTETFNSEGIRTPKTLEIFSGGDQEGAPGAALDKPFVVEVRDGTDKPLPGVEVTFSVTGGGGTLSVTSATTDKNGRAESTLTLGPNPGINTVTVSVTGIARTETFNSEGIRTPKTLEIFSGGDQEGAPGAALENPLVVEVRDQTDKPLPGVQVTFSVTGGGGTLSATSAMADVNGRAESILTLGPNLGINTVTVSVTGIQEQQTFTAEGIRIPLAFWIISGDKQQGLLGEALANPFVVEVRGQSGDPLPGVQVTFSVSSGGGTLSATITTTDNNGRVKSTLTLGPNPGTNTVKVAATGIHRTQSVSAIAELPPIPQDVNRDDMVNILDLVLVASVLGDEGGDLAADVNGDGVVNILDLVSVAGALGDVAAAPSTNARALAMLTAADVGQWLAQAGELELTEATSQRGVLFLEQLLAALTPKETALLPNYPNPFNPETWIPYRLSEDADVTLTIYDTTGVVVRRLDLGHQLAGHYADRGRAAYWDGRNARGESVASGVYFYTLTAGDFTATRKMLIRK